MTISTHYINSETERGIDAPDAPAPVSGAAVTTLSAIGGHAAVGEANIAPRRSEWPSVALPVSAPLRPLRMRGSAAGRRCPHRAGLPFFETRF
jgi:hypothetical protein